jgi:hypothetical protein
LHPLRCHGITRRLVVKQALPEGHDVTAFNSVRVQRAWHTRDHLGRPLTGSRDLLVNIAENIANEMA